MEHPLDAGQGVVERAQVRAGDRIDQCRSGSRTTQLDQVRPLAVAVAGRSLSIDGDRAVGLREGRDDTFEGGRFGDDIREPLPRFEEGLGSVRHRRVAPRCDGMATTPAGSGSRPAAVVSTSPQARTCGVMSCSSGVQDARISMSAVGGSSAMPPKDSDATRVTVPLAAVYGAPCPASASVSQAQPTAGRNGSAAMSGSSAARTYVTSRYS